VVASPIFYAVVCWSGGMAERDRGKLNKLVRKGSSVLDCPLKSIEQLGEERMLSKLTSIMDNTAGRSYQQLSDSITQLNTVLHSFGYLTHQLVCSLYILYSFSVYILVHCYLYIQTSVAYVYRTTLCLPFIFDIVLAIRAV